jgi:hypothetical protein
MEKIATEGNAKLQQQRLLRREVNRVQQRKVKNNLITLIGNQTAPEFCGVINP